MRILFLGLWSAGIAVASGTSCVLELQHVLACGDGYVDAAAGEECEPDLPESYAGGCDGTGIIGLARCDDQTCTVVCEGCGDGVVQDALGDGPFAEECDEGPYPGDRALETVPVDCAGLEPWNPALPYASGQSAKCTANCYYDRSSCSYCGNGSTEASWPLAPELAGQSTAMSLEENCDGDRFGPSFVAATCPDGMEPNATCGTDCRSTIPRDGATCCVPTGGPCDDPARCCHASREPGSLSHCENPITGVPIPGDDPGDGGLTCR